MTKKKKSTTPTQRALELRKKADEHEAKALELRKKAARAAANQDEEE